MSFQTRLATGPLIMLALTACAPQPAPETTPMMSRMVNVAAEEQRIRALDRQWVEAVAARDVDRAASFYAPDAVFMMPNAAQVTGPGIRAAWAGMLDLPNVALSFSPTTIQVSRDGSMAYDVGTYTFGFNGPQGRVQDRGKYLVVWRKVGDQWKVAADMFNSDMPAPGS